MSKIIDLELTQEMIDKHRSALTECKFQTSDDLRMLIKIVEIAVNHIKDNHDDLPVDVKAIVIVFIKKISKKLVNVNDVTKQIDDYIKYREKNYDKYSSELVWSASDYDRDYGFLMQYLNK